MEITETKVAFESGSSGQIVRGTEVRPEKINNLVPGLILVHGMTSNESNYIRQSRELAKSGVVCLPINLRGHGEDSNKSDGSRDILTIAEGLQDIISAYDYLLTREGIDQHRIGIIGTSYGGALAAMAAVERDVQCLVLRAPAVYSEEMMKMTDNEVMNLNTEIFNLMDYGEISQTAQIKAISSFKGNLLVIASENDEVISEKITKAFIEGSKISKHSEYVVIEDAGHNLTEEKRQDFWNITSNFIATNL